MLFEQLFLNWMPDTMRLELADADFTDPCKVAEQAVVFGPQPRQCTPTTKLGQGLQVKQSRTTPQAKQSRTTPTPMLNGASTTTTRQGSVYNPANFRETPRPAVSSDGGRQQQ